MRRSLISRILAGLLGIWFTINFVAPESGMVGMAMGDGASMNMSIDMSMNGSAGPTTATTPEGVTRNTPEKPAETPKCDHHDCCCSALSPSLLTPQASLAWLPQHIIEHALPQRAAIVFYSEGQLLLPYPNGPPNTVIA